MGWIVTNCAWPARDEPRQSTPARAAGNPASIDIAAIFFTIPTSRMRVHSETLARSLLRGQSPEVLNCGRLFRRRGPPTRFRDLRTSRLIGALRNLEQSSEICLCCWKVTGPPGGLSCPVEGSKAVWLPGQRGYEFLECFGGAIQLEQQFCEQFARGREWSGRD